MSRNVFALSLVAFVALSGCSTHAASLTAASVLPPASAASLPSVSLTPTDGAPAVSLTHGVLAQPLAASTIRLIGDDVMNDDELADDAAAQGYSLQSKIGTPITKTGIVRKTSTGLALETTSGFFKKTTESFTLTASGTVADDLTARINGKAQVKGVLDAAGHTIDVDTEKKVLDLGVLTHWLTRGKLSGVVLDAGKKALAGVAVQAKSEDGYVFTDTTDADGKFTIKTLEAGGYSLTLSKAGFDTAKTGEHPANIKARHNSKFSATLSATPAK